MSNTVKVQANVTSSQYDIVSNKIYIKCHVIGEGVDIALEFGPEHFGLKKSDIKNMRAYADAFDERSIPLNLEIDPKLIEEKRASDSEGRK